MIKLLLAAICHGGCVEFLIKNTNWQDFAITVVLCITSAAIIYKVCDTIVGIIELSHEKKDKSTKRILEDLLKNDQDIFNILKQKMDTKSKQNE